MSLWWSKRPEQRHWHSAFTSTSTDSDDVDDGNNGLSRKEVMLIMCLLPVFVGSVALIGLHETEAGIDVLFRAPLSLGSPY